MTPLARGSWIAGPGKSLGAHVYDERHAVDLTMRMLKPEWQGSPVAVARTCQNQMSHKVEHAAKRRIAAAAFGVYGTTGASTNGHTVRPEGFGGSSG